MKQDPKRKAFDVWIREHYAHESVLSFIYGNDHKVQNTLFAAFKAGMYYGKESK